VDDYLVCVTPAQRPLALRIARTLRGAGRRVAYDLSERSVGRQFRAANQAGAARAVVLGPEEEAAGQALVRTMASGEERRVPLEEIAAD
jgi:histidyl-tRNA synthetase